MTVLAFIVPGPPVPKGRPRVGAGGRVYTPARTRAYEDHVRALSLAAVARCRWRVSKAARYALTVRLYFANARRVDADNCAKAAADALQPYAIPDDAQIVEWHTYKSVDVASPRAEVEVTELAT